MGHSDKPSVHKANVMVSRMALLWFVVRMKRGALLLEQPLGSVMGLHPRLERLGLPSISTWMGCFGGETPKPTRLFANRVELIGPLKRKMNKILRSSLAKTTINKVNEAGEMKVYGDLETLKLSQIYPAPYAKAVVESYSRWLARQTCDDHSSTSEASIDEDDTWSDAEPESIVQTLVGANKSLLVE